MDNLCHTLAGAAFSHAGLRRRTRLATATLMIASNLPDIDVAVFATSTLPMAFRRGWTHGVVAQLLLPPLLAASMYAWGRRRRASPHDAPLSFSGLVLLSYIGVWLHIAMDWMNSYGVRLLKPLSDRWFYGDALYIVDPILYVVFGAGVYLSRRTRRHAGADASRPAKMAVAAAAAYMVLMLGANLWARAEVRAQLDRAGRGSARFMVTPVLGNPLRREVIVDLGDRYEKGTLWFSPSPHFRPAGYGVEVNAADPAVLAIREMPRVQDFLMWSRFPFFVVERTAGRTVVVVNDYRYSGAGGRDGWATQVVEAPGGVR